MDRAVKEKRKSNPRESANVLSLLTFTYTFSLFKKAFKNDLEDDDLYEVVKTCESKKWGDKIENQWNLLKKKNKKPSIVKLLWVCFGKFYLCLSMIHFVWKMVNSISEPIALGKVVSYFKNSQDNHISFEEAICYAGILIGLKVAQCFYFQNYLIYLNTLSLQIRTAFCSLIYRKALRLTPSAMLDISLGNIVTLVTKDVQLFEHCISLFADLWIACVQTVTVCYLIYSRTGYTSFAGISVMFLVLPLQIYIGKIVGTMRQKVNHKTDDRLQSTQEMLSSIKTLKMYVWELFFDRKISEARTKETNHLLKTFYFKIIIFMLGMLSSKIGMYVLIISFVWMEQSTDAELIFYIFSHFHTLQHAMGMHIPMGLGQIAELRAILNRLAAVLNAEELRTTSEQDPYYSIKNPKVELKNVTVNIKKKIAITNITLTLEPGLTIITGHLGCGKSSLLKTILQDYPMNSGDLKVQGRISYASQDPWLFPASIKQNILFGQDYDEVKYKQVVHVCALEFDFDIFENRDETIVADKGLNLSKGQQARINLARAVYKDSEIYLLDDCLTALDPNVQDFVFKKCMQGYLEKKDCICVLVTHNVKHIEQSSKMVILDKGSIKFSGKTTELSETDVLKYTEQVQTKKEEMAEDVADEESKLLETEVEVKKNIYHEIKRKGGVDMAVYWKYFKFGGGFLLFSGILVMFVVAQFSDSYAAKLLSKWVDLQQNLTNLQKINDTSSLLYDKTKTKNDDTLNWYSGMTIGSTILELFRYYLFYSFALRASFRIHERMIRNIINAAMSFFDSCFIGNILNRFSQDMNQVDEALPTTISISMTIAFRNIGVIFLIASVNWRFLFPSTAFLLILIALRLVYIPTGRSLKRLEAASRSPLVGHLNASLEGITTIRAYKAQNVLKDEFDSHQDIFTSAKYTSICMKRAFGFYMDLFSATFITLIILRFMIVDTGTSAGNVGLAITQGLALTMLVQFGLMQWAELENLMTSMERLLEYTKLPQESKDGLTIENWPQKGTVEFIKVCLTYANSHKQVLNNINFALNDKEKIGIVGRTGAGKSSIISTLFRLYNFEGKILIDGVDTKTLSLDFLRQHISIIPQDPVLFSGTIRTNLDPNSKYTDEEIWNALDNVYMKAFISSLDLIVSENDSTFSTGQRQLISIGRAIIRKNKIVVLDEATANMDPETETLIQKTITENFSDCTVFIIAHRLQSVLDCNKVMVMDKGEIIEFDDPMVLLDNKTGTFFKMIKQAGLLGTLE
ncbi:unnamed protein product [Brassicogethes aeneus]|uniref:Uncharacterized protein n=1 Tax=Brassicogethes aeneus TaxID=1431903 RepID=A0A9P0FPT7_BRAAE|nr:unnamed protein product [Brassicogethes aeneus]